jgi:hypothetical protein
LKKLNTGKQARSLILKAVLNSFFFVGGWPMSSISAPIGHVLRRDGWGWRNGGATEIGGLPGPGRASGPARIPSRHPAGRRLTGGGIPSEWAAMNVSTPMTQVIL